MIIRHDIDSDEVAKEITNAVNLYNTKIEKEDRCYRRKYKKGELNHLGKPLETPDEKSKWFEKRMVDHNNRQFNFYALVRIIERVGHKRPFVLMYGYMDDTQAYSNIDGFETYEDAKLYFLSGNR